MAVSMTQLRHLSKMRREGIEGADANLLHVADTEPEEVAKLLGRDLDWLRDVRSQDRAADHLASAIEYQIAKARVQRQESARSKAKTIAEKFEEHSKLQENGMLYIEPEYLFELLETRGFKDLAFRVGPRPGALDWKKLHEVLKACRNTRVRNIRASDRALWIEYATGSGGGRFCLKLEPVRREAGDLLVVPPRQPRDEQQPAVETQYPGIHQEPEPRPPKPPKPEPPPVHPFVGHLLRAFTEEVSP